MILVKGLQKYQRSKPPLFWPFEIYYADASILLCTQVKISTGLFSSQIILSSQSLLSISRKKFFFYSTIWVIFFFHYEKVKYLFSSFEKKKYFFAEKFHLISFPFLQSWTFAIIRLLNRPYLNNRPYERSLWQGKTHP